MAKKINESLLSNLVAAFTGAAIGKAVSNRKPKPATKKSIEKFFKKNPEIKKHAEELQAAQRKIAKSTKKAYDKLSPEAKARIDKLYGGF